jgi:thioesterase domain-containing protein
MNKTCTIDELAVIWKRVLKQASIKPDDNFFELGGNRELTIELVHQLTKLCDRELSPIMIFQAPTIRDMASLLEQSERPVPCPPLFLLKRGAGSPPIFLAHGMGGDATQLFDIAEHLGVNNSVYATQVPGIDGISEPLDSVERMATFFLDAIRKVQPQGPYLLIGYSFGGLVMLEIARRLLAQNETVGFLAMLDTYPHRAQLSWKQKLPLLTRLAVRRLAVHARDLRNRMSQQPPLKSTLQLFRERVHSAESTAWTRYRPEFYPGSLYFLRAQVSSYYPRNPRAVWGSLVGELEVHTVPGDHAALVATQYQAVANLLTEQLQWQCGHNVSRAV